MANLLARVVSNFESIRVARADIYNIRKVFEKKRETEGEEKKISSRF